MTTLRLRLTVSTLLLSAIAGTTSSADTPPTKAPKAGGTDAEIVEKVISARRDYQQSLIALYDHYAKSGDRERAKWVEDELKAYHLAWKPSYRLDIQDLPPASLEAKTNIKEANDLFKMAMDYKNKGNGNEYILNQRRSEVLLQDIFQKYPTSDKIADVAYELGDLYESRAYRQYDRAAAYYERSFLYRRGTRSDARLRAARLYDRHLNERTKAIELYREVISHDTEPSRIKEAEKRLSDLTSLRKKD